jgi:hypothetical protein
MSNVNNFAAFNYFPGFFREETMKDRKIAIKFSFIMAWDHQISYAQIGKTCARILIPSNGWCAESLHHSSSYALTRTQHI